MIVHIDEGIKRATRCFLVVVLLFFFFLQYCHSSVSVLAPVNEWSAGFNVYLTLPHLIHIITKILNEIMTNSPSPLSPPTQTVMEHFNPGLRNLVNLGKNYEKSVAGEHLYYINKHSQ